MRFCKKQLFSAFMTVAAVFVVAPSAHAQTEMAKSAIAKAEAVLGQLKDACAADIQKFCSMVTPGEGRLLLCMMAHEDKISDKCFTTIFDVADAVELTVAGVRRAAVVCAPDIQKHCGNVKAGEGRIAQCLVDNKAKLSPACSGEVAGVEAHIKN